MEQYIGEIRLFGGNFAPRGWAFCHGQLLSISQYDALFTLIGTTYGGDGQTTFALPDLRGRIPLHPSAAHPLGQRGGTETVTLTRSQLPSHSHTAGAQVDAGTQTSPAGAVWSQSNTNAYAAVNANAAMSASAITTAGGSQPHDNMMPFLALNFIISLEGIFPSQN